LAAGRAHGLGFNPLATRPASGRPGGALGFTGLTPLRLVLEVLVGKKLLLAGRPDELRAAIHAPEDPVLELHRSPPRRGSVGLAPARAESSCGYVFLTGSASPVACCA